MRILILEDSKASRLLLTSRLEKEGHKVDAVGNGRQGFFKATSNHYDLFISDLLMPGWDGYKFIEAMEVVRPTLPIMVISSSFDQEEIKQQVSLYPNVIAVLPKPYDFEQIFKRIKKVKKQNEGSVRKMARIVCTIGPASDSPKTVGKLMLAGMNVARLNFSHGDHASHERTLNVLRQAEEEWGKPIAVLQDLCGPKIRTGKMKDNGVELVRGENLVIQADDIEGTAQRISTIAPEILADLRTGDQVLLDDGLLELKVTKEGTQEVECQVVVGGTLKSSKGINLPMTNLSLPSVTAKDLEDLQWGLNHSIDYVALSFVRQADEIRQIKEIIHQAGTRDLRVVAKIEKPEAVENIREIIAVSDAIMIARGDMGVELDAARVPRIQHEIIRMCWEANTPVITATQMLDSMTFNNRPTRAEVTDVSVAVKDGTDAVMLSGETATGVNPVHVVRTMAAIIREEENYSPTLESQSCQLMFDGQGPNQAISAAANLTNIAAIMLLDAHGTLYPQLSKWNRRLPSLLVTKSLHVARHASLYKNIVPVIIRDKLHRDERVFKGIEIGKEWGYVKTNDTIAVVEGGRLTQGGIPQIGAVQLVLVE